MPFPLALGGPRGGIRVWAQDWDLGRGAVVEGRAGGWDGWGVRGLMVCKGIKGWDAALKEHLAQKMLQNGQALAITYIRVNCAVNNVIYAPILWP